MHPVRYFSWVSAPDLLAGFNWTYFYGEGVEEGKREGRGSTFSLVDATPLLQHQARFDLNPALQKPGGVAK